MKNPIADTELIDLLRLGDASALKALMQAHYRSLYDYGMRMVNSEALVKDAIQEVFLGLWEKKERLPIIQSISFYLLGATRNQVIKLLQAEKKCSGLDDMELLHHFHTDGSIEEKLIKDENAGFRQKQVRLSLNKLTTRQKEVVYLRYFQELDPAQISELLQLSPQSVYNLLHEALTRLRSIWVPGVFMKAV